jgi:hypothetical protein
MSGSKSVTVITDRDRQLLEALITFRVVDREQARLISGFTSIGRANKRLLKLVRAGLLKRFFMPTGSGGVGALYTLSTKAIQLLGSNSRPIQRKNDALITTDLFAIHQLAINSVLLKTKQLPGAQLARLLTFRSILSKAISLQPDAYFELKTAALYPMFLEVDLGNESLKILEKKAHTSCLPLQESTNGSSSICASGCSLSLLPGVGSKGFERLFQNIQTKFSGFQP